jgi:hypothetical protein
MGAGHAHQLQRVALRGLEAPGFAAAERRSLLSPEHGAGAVLAC